MKTFQEFVLIAEAAYDASVMGSSQIRRIGDGGKIGSERKKTAPERRRTKRVGGGQTVPAKEYKPRSDIGQQKGSQTQAPTQERGSADVKAKAAAAAKAERAAAARARIAAKKKGETVVKAPKPTESELKAQARKLTSRKAAAPQREKQVKTVKGDYTRAEKAQLKRLGRRTLRDLVLQATGKKKESELKHKFTGTGDEGGKD